MNKNLDISNFIPYVYTEKGLMSTEFILSENKKRKAHILPYSSPLKVTLELTDKCNQHCIHCYNNSGATKSNDMSIDKWISVCHQLGKMKVFSCILSGGEPTLFGERLFELLEVMGEYEISFGMNTNGTLINEEVITKLQGYNFEWIQISMDGAKEETHNLIRRCNCWERMLFGAKLIRESGIPLTISFVINKFNYKEIGEAVDLCYFFGAKKIVFTIFECLGRAKENVSSLGLNTEEKVLIYKKISKKHKQYIGIMDVQIIPESVLAQAFQVNMINDTILIRPNGDVKIGCFMPFVIGNVQSGSIQDIWTKKGKNAWNNNTVVEYVSMYRDCFLSMSNNKEKSTKNFNDVIRI